MLTTGTKRYFKWPLIWINRITRYTLLLSFFSIGAVSATEVLPQLNTETLSVSSTLFSDPADFVVTLPNGYTKQTDKR